MLRKPVYFISSVFIYLCYCYVNVLSFFIFFFFNDTATTEIYTLSLHDALPISGARLDGRARSGLAHPAGQPLRIRNRSEEHTSELQSHSDLVCRLLLEKKKKKKNPKLNAEQ